MFHKPTGAVAGIRNIFNGATAVKEMGFNTGFLGLTKGWGPTAWGYSLQGLGKFGFYELFKHEYGSRFSKENEQKYKDLIYIAASASAEFIADVALCPFEAVKVR